MSAEIEFEKLAKQLAQSHDGVAGQMFGKRCVKVNGKAAIALFEECLVFKLSTDEHALAISLDNSVLWDPSGKGRAMKEWVQLGLEHKRRYKKLAIASAEYVS